jgi:hypothetical protein
LHISEQTYHLSRIASELLRVNLDFVFNGCYKKHDAINSSTYNLGEQISATPVGLGATSVWPAARVVEVRLERAKHGRDDVGSVQHEYLLY